MTHPLSLALAQLCAEPYEAAKNRSLTLEASARAFEMGADIVVLPEMILQGYVADKSRLAPLAETVPGPTTKAWQQLAADHGKYICGGLCERDGNDLYNTAVLVGPSGVALHYRKLHLFGDEKVTFRQGDRGLPVVHTSFGTVGICVCYDLRFVEVVRALTLKGADLILVPTAWLPGFDQQRWDADGMCPQAYGALFQSNLSQCFIACASQVGRHGGSEFLGSSIVADPYGKRALGPLPMDAEDITVVELDMAQAKLAQVRSTLIAPRADRRRDVYGIAIDGDIL
ncbi:MAG: hydratase [Actinobacteria bacterium]|nr:hydratase [Actinomycetota bacterium]